MAIGAVLMGGLKSLLSGDGLVAKGMEFVNKRWPPNMSEEQKAQMGLLVETALHNQKLEIMDAARQDEQQFNDRTIALEGTASDLKTIPYVGGLIIFMRGAFRPAFSYFTAWLDYLYFTSSTMSIYDSQGLLLRVVQTWTDRQEVLLLAMNLLVLIFFFGERAMKNVLPLIMQVFAGKKAE